MFNVLFVLGYPQQPLNSFADGASMDGKLDRLVSSLPRGVGLGVTCLIGMPNTPSSMQSIPSAMQLRNDLINWAFSEIDFENRSCRVLPNAPSLAGIGFTGTSGFPLAAPHDPFHSTLGFAKELLGKIDALPETERASLGLVGAVLAVDTIYSANATEFTTTLLPGLTVTEQSTKIIRQIFLHLNVLLGSENASSIIVATESFWTKIRHDDPRAVEIDAAKIDSIKLLSEEIKKERLFLLDVTPEPMKNLIHLRSRTELGFP